ncbi:MAG: hypothetical protein K2Q34_06840, partial [Alphaproteobacteria bacterium]|nr:hypothetical protein [Alphaproteobacteria bacterium]
PEVTTSPTPRWNVTISLEKDEILPKTTITINHNIWGKNNPEGIINIDWKNYPDFNDLYSDIKEISANLLHIIRSNDKELQKYKEEFINNQSTQNNVKNNYQSELNKNIATIAKHDLFLTSAVSGAVYSLVPEIVNDGIEYLGYSRRASKYATTFAQAVLIMSTTSDYVPTLTGTAVKMGFDWLGASSRVSAIAGSTTALVTSVVRADMAFNQEALLDCTIALAGGFVGSTWALQTKDWVYSFWKKGKTPHPQNGHDL